MMRLAAIVVFAAAVGIAVMLTLPPRPLVLDPPAALGEPVRGIVHIHSRRSDGSGTIDDIAAAARRAGLRFVIVTDHGDATRAPDPPSYRDGVLCIDAVEISTFGGHLVAIGLPQAPYPLAGEPRDVVEDVERMGAFAEAAHPGSPKPGLRWTDWTAPIDGLEWMNGDSEWRDESAFSMARALLAYPARGASALAHLLDRPDAVLRQWDALTLQRPIVGLAAADAHARIGTRGIGEGSQGGLSLHIPSYEQVFRTFSIALPQVRLTGDAAADAAAVVREIRHGHVYSTIDGLAAPATMMFTATSGDVTAHGGDTIAAGAPVTLHVLSDAPSNARVVLLKDGVVVQESGGGTWEYAAGGEAAVYRVEIRLPDAPGTPPVPWIVSNPIYVRSQRTSAPTPSRPAPAHLVRMYDNGPAAGWRIEHSARSAGAFDIVPAVGGTQIAFRYALGGTASEGPYAALVMPAGAAIGTSDRLTFTAHADRPMRVSVQLRAPGAAGERWRRSVYLDDTPRTVSVFFDDMTPVGEAAPRPSLGRIESVLWVVDTVNTKPGSNGRVWIDDVQYGQPATSSP